MAKYLIFGGPGIGDTIFEIITAQTIKQCEPEAQVDVLVSDALSSTGILKTLLECQSGIDTLYTYSKSSFFHTIKILLKLRFNKYKYSFSCSSSFKSNSKPALVSKIIGTTSVIKEVAGKTGKIDIPVSINGNKHIVEQHFELLKAVGLYCESNINPLLCDKVKNIYPIPNNQKSIVTLCIGANVTIYKVNGKPLRKQIKDWGVENWINLSDMLVRNGYTVVMIGGRGDADTLNNHCGKEFVKEDVINCVGKTSIPQSLSILAQSTLVIGADTGMMHCASGLGKKTLTLFGGTDPLMWKPYSKMSYVIRKENVCTPCYGTNKAISCQRRKCMESITVQDVYDLAIKLI